MFIRVKDKTTGHQYDVAEGSFNTDRHEKVARIAPSKVARPAKPNTKARKKTSAPKAVEGVSPAGE